MFVPRKAPHRLRCFGQRKARVKEIWIGDSDEEDILRRQDEYEREEC